MRFLVPIALAVAAFAAFFLLRSPKDVPLVLETRLVLEFPGASFWKAEERCTGLAEGDICGGEWTHDNGQKARVLLLPILDSRQLDNFTRRLKEKVEAGGGVVEEFEPAQLMGQSGAPKDAPHKIVRLLQPAVRDEDNARMVNVTYVLPGPDNRVLHLLTSLVREDDQVGADGRLRDLLAFGVWTTPGDN